jgi:aldehyde dehydrogenase (NAD(P)+)
VHEKVYDDFLKLFIAYTKKISVIGDPFDEKTWHGPQVSKGQYEKILAYVESAKEEGASILMGGTTAEDRPNGKGYFITPTVVGDVTPDMKVCKEEIFGPFAVVSKFNSDAEVLTAANNTDYALAAAIFTNNVTRAMRVSQKLEAGTVWINSDNNSDLRVPFGGNKQSGIGRELGEAGMEGYSRLKSVHLNLVFAEPDI